MILMTTNYAQGFASCSGTMLEGLTPVANYGPYAVGSAAASTTRLPNAQMEFTWTCDGAVVGTLTRPKDSFCGETVFLAAVVGKKGGNGSAAPSVTMIQGRTCPIPNTTTTSTTTEDTTTVTTSTATSSVDSFLSGTTADPGQYRGAPLGVMGGAMRAAVNVFVKVALLFAVGHLAP